MLAPRSPRSELKLWNKLVSNQSVERTTSRYRPELVCGIVFLSIVLPLVLIAAVVFREMRDKGTAALPSKTLTSFSGDFINGELRHLEANVANFNDPPINCRIKCLDLTAGIDKDSDGEVTVLENGSLKRMGNELYCFGLKDIFRLEGNAFEKIGPRANSVSGLFQASTFLWEGRVTTIVQSDKRGHRLIHLEKGKWIDGHPIVLPSLDLVWKMDEQRGCYVLSSPSGTTTTVNPPSAQAYSIQVVEHNGEQHLLLSDYNQFAAYRSGFEFVREPDSIASALAPLNAPPVASGWEPVGSLTTGTSQLVFQMESAGSRLMFLDGNISTLLVQNSDGKWSSFKLKTSGNDWPQLIVDASTSEAMLVQSSTNWSSASFQRITEKGIEPAHLVISGVEAVYLARWKRIAVSVIVAWLLHVAILIGGAMWLARRRGEPTFEFGHRQVTLAPLWRRAVATAIDATLFLVAVSGLWTYLTFHLAWGLPEFDEVSLAHELFDLEQFFNSLLLGMPFMIGGGGTFVVAFANGNVDLKHDQLPEILCLLLIAAGSFGIVKTAVEARVGWTPGKWLLDLRTVRTTLRPCGLARAIVRNAFYCFDLLLLLTPLPAAISVMFSDHNQTLGDRAADTLVIRAGSTVEVSR